MQSNYSSIGVGKREIRNIINLKKLVVAGVATVIGFYTFPYILPFLKLPSLLWLNLAASGIFAFIIAEVLY